MNVIVVYMSKNKDVKNYKYKVYRKEISGLVPLLNTDTEDETFKLIAKNDNYIITYNNKDVTDKYR